MTSASTSVFCAFFALGLASALLACGDDASGGGGGSGGASSTDATTQTTGTPASTASTSSTASSSSGGTADRVWHATLVDQHPSAMVMGEAECTKAPNSAVLACEVTFAGIEPYEASVVYVGPITGDNVIFDFPPPYVSPLNGSKELDLVDAAELSNGNVYVSLVHPQGEARGKLEPVQ